MLPAPLKPYAALIYIGGFLAVIGAGAYLYYDMNRPATGSWRYGVCRTFVELETRYPHTINVTQVVEDARYAEIYVSFINAHGVRPTRVYKCNYKQTETGQILVDDIYVDFDRISDEKIDLFNKMVPFLIESKDIDTTLPNWEGMSIEALRPD